MKGLPESLSFEGGEYVVKMRPTVIKGRERVWLALHHKSDLKGAIWTRCERLTDPAYMAETIYREFKEIAKQ